MTTECAGRDGSVVMIVVVVVVVVAMMIVVHFISLGGRRGEREQTQQRQEEQQFYFAEVIHCFGICDVYDSRRLPVIHAIIGSARPADLPRA